MKTTIRKSPSLLYLQYQNGNYTNNLYGSLFTIESYEGSNVLSINFSRNFKTKNKQEKSYHDAVELSEDYKDLKSLSIYEDRVYQYIVKIYKKNPNANWFLELNLNPPETVSLPVKVIPVRVGEITLRIT